MYRPLVQEILRDIEELSEDKLEQVRNFIRGLKVQIPEGESTASQPGLDSRGIFIVWRCTNCGHMFLPDERIPERCPDCGASREEFLLEEED